eukprot:Awhi_evm1s14731
MLGQRENPVEGYNKATVYKDNNYNNCNNYKYINHNNSNNNINCNYKYNNYNYNNLNSYNDPYNKYYHITNPNYSNNYYHNNNSNSNSNDYNNYNHNYNYDDGYNSTMITYNHGIDNFNNLRMRSNHTDHRTNGNNSNSNSNNSRYYSHNNDHDNDDTDDDDNHRAIFNRHNENETDNILPPKNICPSFIEVGKCDDSNCEFPHSKFLHNEYYRFMRERGSRSTKQIPQDSQKMLRRFPANPNLHRWKLVYDSRFPLPLNTCHSLVVLGRCDVSGCRFPHNEDFHTDYQ